MKSGDDWKFLESIWLTDGEKSIHARVDYKVELGEPDAAPSIISNDN